MRLRRIAVCGFVLVASLAAAPAARAASIILPTGSTWEYTFTDPTSKPKWHWKGAWNTATAPFGNCDAQCIADHGFSSDFAYSTFWNSTGPDRGDDLWLRKTIDLSGYDLNSIRWGLGVDNGFKLYVNGTLVVSHNGEGFTSTWEYPLAGWHYFGGPAYLTPYLKSGLNVISLALEDHGGYTAFEMEMTGDRVPGNDRESVPEPATLALFGLGTVAFARRLRRSRP